MASTEDLIMKARCRLLVLEPWYGTMASLMDWVPSHQIDNIAIDLRRSRSRFRVRWNPNLSWDALQIQEFIMKAIDSLDGPIFDEMAKLATQKAGPKAKAEVKRIEPKASPIDEAYARGYREGREHEQTSAYLDRCEEERRYGWMDNLRG